MRKLTPREMEPGMILLDEVKTPIGQHLADAGEEVTRQLINRMKLYKVEFAYVRDEITEKTNPEESNDTISEKSGSTASIKKHEREATESARFHGFEMQYYMAIEKMKVVFQETLDQKKEIDTTDLLDSVSDLFRSRSTIIELFEMLYKMHSLSDSVYAHSLNVALISRMIGRWLHMDRHDLDNLTLAGLLHDIGKLTIPEEILNKTGSLTDEEFALIKSHPKRGYEILKNLSLNPRIKKSALMHHERSDGSGYPNGLEDDFIDEYAMIIAIADVYDAMTAARSYRAPLCPFQVIANFQRDGYQKYHTRYILTFLNKIATTYQNSRVILNDGRGAKIVMINANDLSNPIVQFTDNSCLDLSTEKDLYIQQVLA